MRRLIRRASLRFLTPALILGVAGAASLPALGAGGEASSGAPAAGAGGSNLQFAMTIYAGGVALGSLDMDATIRGDEYHAVSNLKTAGLANAFFQAEIQATSSGHINGRALTPALYNSFYTGANDRKQQVSLTYANGAPPRLFADPMYRTSGFEVDSEQQKNTYDPLSAMMFIVSSVADARNPCAGTAPIFDGRRRYNVEMERVRDVDVSMDNGLYRGKAVQCQIRYRQIAGYRPGVLAKNKNFPLINAWVAVVPGSQGRTYAVPLRLWAVTPYGQMSVVTSAVTVDGRKLAPQG